MNELLRLKDEFDGAVFGMGVGLLFGGVVGAIAGAYLGSQVGWSPFSTSEWLIDREFGEGDWTTQIDIADHWTYPTNRSDLLFVLDTLFELANKPRPRAVFILGGDVHAGALHLIRSGRPEHARNPAIMQVTSSPISREPPTESAYRYLLDAISHYQSGMTLTSIAASFLSGSFQETQARYYLDPPQPPPIPPEYADIINPQLWASLGRYYPGVGGNTYEALFLGLISQRNIGDIRFAPVRGGGPRAYRFVLGVEGAPFSVRSSFQLDLDAASVRPTQAMIRRMINDLPPPQPGLRPERPITGDANDRNLQQEANSLTVGGN